MSEHTAIISWSRDGAVFSDNRYSRAHVWLFDGGIEVPASPLPYIVPVPLSNPDYVDPEEAFVAAVSSCHMLWFLALAAKQQFVVDSYVDAAVGIMEENQQGALAITHIKLRPTIGFNSNDSPSDEQIHEMHELAHKNCYIANSIRTVVTVESVAAS